VLYERAIGALPTIWPDVERDAQLGQVLRSNAATLTGRAGVNGWQSAAQALLWRTGISLAAWGLVHPAMRHWEQVASDARRHLGPDDPYTLAARGNAADCRLEAGDPRGAAVALEQLLADHSRVRGPDHPDTLTTRSHLARCRGRAGDLAGAVGAFGRLLADCLRVLGPTTRERSVLAATSPTGPARPGPRPAQSRRSSGCWPTACGYWALIIGTHTARVNLARCYSRAGNVAGSAAMDEQALADRLQDLGPDNPETLLLRHNPGFHR
jgi:hypothetical protein